MADQSTWLEQLAHVYAQARASDDGTRCTVAPSPDLRERINKDVATLRAAGTATPFVRVGEPVRPGLNDGIIVPADEFPLGAPMSMLRAAAAERAPLAGVVRVIVVLVDFSDHHMVQTAAHFNQLFFSTGVLPKKSVREYYQDVTHGIIDIQGQVVGPLRMPQTLAAYAHGDSGMGTTLPNARTMARDAVIAADPLVNFAPFDNNGDGFVDAFIVIHAGPGAEVTGSASDIWSHKWTLDGGAKTVDGTKVFGYLTVPEDAKIGVCCHELGHLLFGFPDLYDTDGTSEGVGNWCLMGAGSWGGGGDTPTHPSAWCKVNQGWASVDNRTTNGTITIPDVKSSHSVVRLWKDGAASSEYFLVENRQQTGFDASLPGSGILFWHIDDSISGNTNEAHPKVGLLQADGKRDLELNHNRGDAGDPYPGTGAKTSITDATTPNTKSYAGVATCVALTSISASAAVMTANAQVKCKFTKETKEIAKDTKDHTKEKEISKDTKDLHKEKEIAKDAKDHIKEKEISKDTKDLHKEVTTEKPVIDKKVEKPITEKTPDKLTDIPHGGLTGLGGGGGATNPSASLEQRLSDVESLLGQIVDALSHSASAATGSSQPFIGQELRPDLRRGALTGEPDLTAGSVVHAGPASEKRSLDKGRE